MPTSNELKALIATQITNQTQLGQTTHENVGGRMEDIVDHIDESIELAIENIPSGPAGSQGVQGIQGPPGPVGPAGLTWRGTWEAATTYSLNDSVGYNGASYYNILVITGNVSNTNPTVDTTHWALLAAQGAIGPQGVQGPTGPQGPIGPSGAAVALTSGSITSSGSYPAITTDIAYTSGPGGVTLPDTTGMSIGTIKYVKAYSDTQLRGNLANQPVISIDGVNSNTSSVFIKANQSYKFTYLGSGYWQGEYINGNPLKVNGFTVQNNGNISISTTNPTTTSLTTTQLNTTYSDLQYPIGFIVLCPNISTIYTKTSSNTWNTDYIKNYKSYCANLYQTGTSAPSPIVFENNIGNIVWSRNSAGSYIGTCTGAFLNNKTFFPVRVMKLDTPSGTVNANIILGVVDVDRIQLTTMINGVNSDGVLEFLPIEVRVYN